MAAAISRGPCGACAVGACCARGTADGRSRGRCGRRCVRSWCARARAGRPWVWCSWSRPTSGPQRCRGSRAAPCRRRAAAA
eukprot:7484461-Lingulodinium_polyedra.AAC.1